MAVVTTSEFHPQLAGVDVELRRDSAGELRRHELKHDGERTGVLNSARLASDSLAVQTLALHFESAKSVH